MLADGAGQIYEGGVERVDASAREVAQEAAEGDEVVGLGEGGEVLAGGGGGCAGGEVLVGVGGGAMAGGGVFGVAETVEFEAVFSQHFVVDI